jgi:putative methionine-R-sulfoxide reductase with GAF domain
MRLIVLRPMSHQSSRYDFRDKAADYAALAQELEGLLNGEHDLIANAANATSLIFTRFRTSTGVVFISYAARS